MTTHLEAEFLVKIPSIYEPLWAGYRIMIAPKGGPEDRRLFSFEGSRKNGSQFMVLRTKLYFDTRKEADDLNLGA